MYIELIVALVGFGSVLSWRATLKADGAAMLERLSGACLLGGLSLLGLALPLASRLGAG